MNTAVLRTTIIGVAMLSVAAQASAQWSFTAQLGDATTSATRLDLRSPASNIALEPVAFADESSRSPWYYGLRVTRAVARPSWLSIEAQFIHAKAIANPDDVVRTSGMVNGVAIDRDQPLGATLPRFELSHGLNILVGNAVVHWPIVRRAQRPFVEVVGRAGAGVAIPHVETTFMSQATDEYQVGGWAFAGAIGADVRLSSHVSGVVDLLWTTTRVNLDIGAGELEGRFTTRHVVFGVGVRP